MVDPMFIVIDLFCGAGGTTTGFAKARRLGNIIAKDLLTNVDDEKESLARLDS